MKSSEVAGIRAQLGWVKKGCKQFFWDSYHLQSSVASFLEVVSGEVL